MALNVEAGFVDGGATVYAADLHALYPTGSPVPGLGADGSISINALMAAADAELGLHGSVRSGSPFRPLQSAMKNALDLANNNQNFII
jgi:hypothetical protein